jgi:hypothetical protein
LIRRFSSGFELMEEGIPRSFPNRINRELFMLWRRKESSPQPDFSINAR